MFGHYLAGVIEGGGSIHVRNYPSIKITFANKDLAYALLIQKTLGSGSLQKFKGHNSYVLTINNLIGLLKVISLINGKMRTPMIYSL
jgi:hypothetical protein